MANHFKLVPNMAGDIAVVDWSDEGDPGDPARLNSPRHADRYLRVGHAGLPTTIIVEGWLDGAVIPDDETLGVFIWWWSQRGNGAPPVISLTPLQSPQARIIFEPENLGTWVLTAYCASHGSVRIGLSVETAG